MHCGLNLRSCLARCDRGSSTTYGLDWRAGTERLQKDPDIWAFVDSCWNDGQRAYQPSALKKARPRAHDEARGRRGVITGGMSPKDECTVRHECCVSRRHCSVARPGKTALGTHDESRRIV